MLRPSHVPKTLSFIAPWTLSMLRKQLHNESIMESVTKKKKKNTRDRYLLELNSRHYIRAEMFCVLASSGSLPSAITELPRSPRGGWPH